MSLSAEEKVSFTPIIDSILAASDLNTISEKRIRRGLQAAVDYDITPQKDALKELIMSRFDLFMAKTNGASKVNGHVTTDEVASSMSPAEIKSESPLPGRGTKRESDEDMSDLVESPKPKKKRKVEQDGDAVLAARLQAIENSRSRATRGGGPKANKVTKKKVLKKKSAGKVRAEDDSDVDDTGSEVKERKINRNSGFHKEMMLSAPLSALFDGETRLSRPQSVKRIWAYVREHDLQDPSDKRLIICDDRLRPVFKQEKVHMFTMNKILNQNLYAVDE